MPVLRLLWECTDQTARRQMAAATVLVVIGAGFGALAPLALKHLVDALTTQATSPPQTTSHAVAAYAALYIGVLCGARLLGDVRPALANAIDRKLVATLRQRFFWHVLRLPIGSLVRRRNGELLHTLDLACSGAQLFASHLVSSLAPVAVELAVMSVVLAQIGQPTIVVLFGVTAALYLAVFAAGSARIARQAGAVTAGSIAVHGHLADGLANVEAIRCFGAERKLEQELALSNVVLMECWRRYYRSSSLIALSATAVFAASLSACLAIAAKEVAEGTLTVGGFVLACIYLLQMVRPLEVLGAASRDITRSVGFMRPLVELLREDVEGQPKAQHARVTSPAPAPARPPSIRFEGLTFGYDPHRPVVQDLNLEIAAGSTTALVGPSGSGKSSLIRLLLRLYAPQAGQILLGDEPIDDLPLSLLREQIALVPQDTPLLHASVADNIALGSPGASHDSVIAAARAAQLHDVIAALPDGYSTTVGERGLKLSGGERQRLAIARALLRRPRLLLLDEPTSMLDSRTEAAVLASLQTASLSCTTLIVAHRLSTVVDSDEIIYLSEGRIRERGTHRELMIQGGLYAQLWHSQVRFDAHLEPT